jgi:hypothetical protein
MDANVKVGELYEHVSGLVLRVIGQHVPGDRDDELRVWCEVVGVPRRWCEVIRARALGLRVGWCLLEQYGWKRVEGETSA